MRVGLFTDGLQHLSRREAFAALPPTLASRSRSSAFTPTLSLPSMMAIVAGTAPFERTTASTRCAISRFCG